MKKPWYEVLLGLLAGLWTQEQLGRAGASPEAAAGALTLQVGLPTFGAGVPQPPAGLSESRDLADADPELVRRYELLKSEFKAHTGRDLFETCTWRSVERQAELYQVGRRGVPGEKILTKLDGATKRSRHNVYPSQAVDVCVDSDPGRGKHAVWDASAYAPLGPLAAEFGLIWGGDWAMHDYPHLELPA